MKKSLYILAAVILGYLVMILLDYMFIDVGGINKRLFTILWLGLVIILVLIGSAVGRLTSRLRKQEGQDT